MISFIEDENNLVETKTFPYAKWSYDKFNPVQSAISKIYDQDCNIVVAASTSAGKTLVAEMIGAYEIRKNNKKMTYLSPLKALATEKYTRWNKSTHHFADKKTTVISGDFRLTEQRLEEVNSSDIIVMTSEMLSHRSRNHKGEKSQYLKEIGVVVVDESHLITVPGRGDHLEAGLMKFSKINPTSRIVLLSATMNNVEQLAEWLHSLNGKKTYIINSSYRPQPLHKHFIEIEDRLSYSSSVSAMMDECQRICLDYPKDKFIVFVHTKKIGNELTKRLNQAKISSAFHNADVDMYRRQEIESDFTNNTNLRVIVATTTLAWGIDVPARRVIVMGTRRYNGEVANYDIQQMIGRAGRIGWDPQGDAYIFVPASIKLSEIKRVEDKCTVNSCLPDTDVNGMYHDLAFHALGEFLHDSFTYKDIFAWFKRSFATMVERRLMSGALSDTFELLVRVGILTKEKDAFTLTKLGKVSVYNYVSPFLVASYKKQFGNLFNSNQEQDMSKVAIALGNQETYKEEWLSQDEKLNISKYYALVKRDNPNMPDGCIKASYVFDHMLQGKELHFFFNLKDKIKYEFERTIELLKQIDTMSGGWKKGPYFDGLMSQVKYGVKPHLISLVQIPNIGKIRAEKLYAAGFKTQDDIASDPIKAGKVAGIKFNVEKKQ